jgi:hypothetical protein
MTDQVLSNRPVVATAPNSTDAVNSQQVNIYSHSTLLYWWPAWAFGFVVGLLNLAQERFLSSDQHVMANSVLDLSYVSMLLLLIIFTNIRLRGIKSVVVILAVGFVAVLLAWLGWWGEIISLLPYLSVQMNTGFYLVFSTALFFIWMLMFFIFDRMTYWRIRPGQMTVEHIIGGGAESIDTEAVRFQKLSSDLFRTVLGLGAGDLQATGVGPPGTTLNMSNVLFAEHKIHQIERLIAVKPDVVT